MKLGKTLVCMVVIAVLCAAIPSCKKCYTCTSYGVQYGQYCTNDYTPSQLNALDSSCVHNGEVWSIFTN